MEQATANGQGAPAVEVAAMLASIDARLAHLEDVLSRYEPLLAEVARRMAGPMKWRKT